MCFNKYFKTKEEADIYKNSPPIAQEDILVYKVLTLSKRAPYMHMQYVEGETYNAELQVDILVDFHNCCILAINEGLHSYSCKEQAEELVEFLNKVHEEDNMVVQMTIPKGATYYNNRNFYVSNQLFYGVKT